MRLLVIIIFNILIIGASSAHAAAPFGLEIGKTQLTEVRTTYLGERDGINKWTSGPHYQIYPTELDIEGLISARAIFDQNETLVGLLLKFRKDRFETLNAMASENYTLRHSNIPFVGDKGAIYTDGETDIELSSPHMGFHMTMYFLHQSLITAFEAGSAAEKNETAKKENQALFGK